MQLIKIADVATLPWSFSIHVERGPSFAAAGPELRIRETSKSTVASTVRNLVPGTRAVSLTKEDEVAIVPLRTILKSPMLFPPASELRTEYFFDAHQVVVSSSQTIMFDQFSREFGVHYLDTNLDTNLAHKLCPERDHTRSGSVRGLDIACLSIRQLERYPGPPSGLSTPCAYVHLQPSHFEAFTRIGPAGVSNRGHHFHSDFTRRLKSPSN